MKSKTFSGRSLRSSLKGSTWILVLLLLGFMVAFPVAELMLIGNQTDEIHRMTFAMICSYLIVPGFLVIMLCLPLRTGTGHSFMGAGNDVFQNEYGT